MIEYHKIQSIFKRDENTHKFIEGQYSLPEFEYLRDNQWEFTEKIDGTNIRIGWNGVGSKIGGRTESAQIPTFLYSKLTELFPEDKLADVFPDVEGEAILFGEGYGAKIQKGGNYIPDGIDFILFDVKIGDWWLKREDVLGIAKSLAIRTVPVLRRGTLDDAVSAIKAGVKSTFGDFLAEGMVLRPTVELKSRSGHRIITKIKHRDF